MILDTNCLIRYATEDDLRKSKEVRHFLLNEPNIIVTDVVLAEVYWTLKSFYKFQVNDILDFLESLINRGNIECNKTTFQRAINLQRKYSAGFIDACLASQAIEKCDGKLASYDKDFDKIKEIKRIQPK